MSQTRINEFVKYLNPFPKIINKAVVAKALSELMQFKDYENLGMIFEELARQQQGKELLTDDLLALIIRYLGNNKSKSTPNPDVLFVAFSLDKLATLEKVSSQLMALHSQAFTAWCDAICLYGLSASLLDKNKLNVLLKLNIAYLQEEAGIHKINTFANKNVADLKIAVRILNIIIEEATIEAEKNITHETIVVRAIQKLGDESNFVKLNKIFSLLDLLGIKAKSITNYLFLLEFSPVWFEEKNKNYISALKNCISSPPPYGVEFVSRYIHLFHDDPEKFQRLFTRYSQIQRANVTPLLNDMNLVLILEERFFSEANLAKALLFMDIDPRASGTERYQLIKRIQELKIEIDSAYIQALNKLIQKTQLEYASGLCFLSDTWLTKEGLEKLDQFSEKYLTTQGLKLIGCLNIDITPEKIKEINEADHTGLLSYFETALEKRARISDLVHDHTARTKKIDDHIVGLKEQNGKKAVSASDNVTVRKRANVDLLLEGECPFTWRKLISNQESDAIIFMHPKRKGALEFTDLNELCLIPQEKGDHDGIYHKKTAQSYVTQGVNHPFENRKLLASDIKNLDATHIDLDDLNRKLNLRQNEAEHNQDCISEQVSWCIELKKHTNLLKIPAVFFLEKNLELLFKLDPHYLTDPVRLKYLHIIIRDSVSEDDIRKLNHLTEQWFNHPAIATLLQNFPQGKQITDLTEKGFYTFALEDIENAKFIFWHHGASLFTHQELIDILKTHRNNEKFPKLLKAAASNITTRAIHAFTSEDKELYQQIYQSYLLDQEQSSATDVFQALRDKIKQDLMAEFSTEKNTNKVVLSFLKNLRNNHDEIIQNLRNDLAIYGNGHFRRDKQGNLYIPWRKRILTPKERLVAYQALREDSDNKADMVVILTTIRNQRANIGLYDELYFLDGLQTCTKAFLESVGQLRTQIKQFLSHQYKFSKTKNDIAVCLLDDYFYLLLDNRDLYRIAYTFPKVFFYILELYRPSELSNVLQNQDCKLQYDNFYKNKKENDQSEGSLHLSRRLPQRTLPERIESPSEYQLQDNDGHVGLSLLRNELETKQPQKDLVFMPLGPIDQNERVNAANLLQGIQDITEKNRGKICFGIFNVNTNHYFLTFFYTPLQGPTQILIIDPAYPTPEKVSTAIKIKNLFKKQFKGACAFVDAEIIQQFNDSDCGIACLQTVKDTITNGAVTVINDQLILHREKLTLDAHRYIGKERDFVTVAQNARREWETQLSKQHESYILYPDNDKVFEGPYSFESNKKLQALKTNTHNILSNIVQLFREHFTPIIEAYFAKNQNVPYEIPIELNEKINQFLQANAQCKQYLDILDEIKNIVAVYPSERIDFDQNTLEKRLQDQVQQVYRDMCYKSFDDQFINYLEKEKKSISRSSRENSLPVNLDELYNEFISLHPEYNGPISFFLTKNWDQFSHVKSKTQEHIEKINKSHRCFSWGYRSKLFADEVAISKNNREEGDQEALDSLKAQLDDALNYVIIKLRVYPPKPQRSFREGWHTSQKQVNQLIENCTLWRNWFANQMDLAKIKSQQLYIAKELFKALSKLSSDSQSVSNLIRRPLAKFMGMPDETIQNYDQDGTVSLRYPITYRTQSSFFTVEINDYDYLQRLIKEQIQQMEYQGIVAHDYTAPPKQSFFELSWEV